MRDPSPGAGPQSGGRKRKTKIHYLILAHISRDTDNIHELHLEATLRMLFAPDQYIITVHKCEDVELLALCILLTLLIELQAAQGPGPLQFQAGTRPGYIPFLLLFSLRHSDADNLRRTFIVQALSMGISPNIVMKWTGHSDYKAITRFNSLL